MHKIDPVTKNIELTRGDVLPLAITAKNIDGSDYTFAYGDIIRFTVFERKDCSCVVMQKDTVVTTEGISVDIDLEKEDTKIGGIIDKPVDYWYEVELNPDTRPQTIVGYEKELGAKIFTLLPEGGDKQ